MLPPSRGVKSGDVLLGRFHLFQMKDLNPVIVCFKRDGGQLLEQNASQLRAPLGWWTPGGGGSAGGGSPPPLLSPSPAESVPVHRHRAGHRHGGKPELWPFQHCHRHHHSDGHQRQPSHDDLQDGEWLQKTVGGIIRILEDGEGLSLGGEGRNQLPEQSNKI